MRSFCPPLDVSAYKLSFKTTEDLDTPEEQLAARQSMVDSLNEEASCECHRRGPRSLAAAAFARISGPAAPRSTRSSLAL